MITIYRTIEIRCENGARVIQLVRCIECELLLALKISLPIIRESIANWEWIQ